MLSWYCGFEVIVFSIGKIVTIYSIVNPKELNIILISSFTFYDFNSTMTDMTSVLMKKSSTHTSRQYFLGLSSQFQCLME